MTVGLDERLREEFERAARPADPSGVYEDLIRRRERQRISQRLRTGALALVVIVGTVAAILALSRLFHPVDEGAVTALVPAQPAATANGLVAFTDGDRIIVQATDGSNAHEVPSPSDGLPWHIAWSPDGTRLAVAIFRDPGRSLWVMRPDGSDATLIAEGSDVSRPSWHPDGVHLAYSLDHDGLTEVHVTRSDGADDRVVYSERARGTYAVFSASFAPDGSQIVFDAGTDVGFDIFVMDADGANVRQITRTGTDYNPSWSPDGRLIAFTRQEGTGSSDIYVMKADGSSVQRLTEDHASTTNLDPQYSPDGTLITYTTVGNGAEGSIIAMNADGSNARTMIEGDVLGFSWQPAPVSESPMTPSPTAATGPEDAEEIELGYPVCDVTSVEGRFVAGVTGTAFVATKAGASGVCPESGEQILAVDVTGDGRADTSFEPLECDPSCNAFAAPDVDGDGTDELLVQNVQFTIAGVRLFELQAGDGGTSIGPVTVAPPGGAEFEGETEPQFWTGGDAGNWDALRCEPFEGRRALVSTTALVPVDEPGAAEVTETWFVLNGYELRVVDVREYTAPNDDVQPYQQTGGCGANIDPYG